MKEFGDVVLLQFKQVWNCAFQSTQRLWWCFVGVVLLLAVCLLGHSGVTELCEV